MKEFSPVYRQEGTAALKAVLCPSHENACHIISFPCRQSSDFEQDSSSFFNEELVRHERPSYYKSLEGIPFNRVSRKQTFWVGLLVGFISIFLAFV